MALRYRHVAWIVTTLFLLGSAGSCERSQQGTKEDTLAYWSSLEAIMHSRTNPWLSDFDYPKVYQEGAERINKLPTLNVDGELVELGQKFAQVSSRIATHYVAVRRAEANRTDTSAFKPQRERLRQELDALGAERQKLRAELAAKYGVAFPGG